MKRTNRKTRAAPQRGAAVRRAKEPTERIALYLAASHVDRIEALRPRYSRPWRKATRSDVLRVIILRGLDAIEEQDTPAQSSARPRVTR
ncbi:MAG: hypothetical protein QM820_29715 [Minicystis sp.]